MKQGEIWEVDLNPIKGSEQGGFRPVVIVSGNLLNSLLQIVIVCPLTSKIKNYKGNLILEPDQVNNLKLTSEVLTFHIRSVSKERLIKRIGRITKPQLNIIRQTLDDILRY